MGIEEELTAKIGELGDKIKASKAEKKAKEEWEPFLNEMLALKVRSGMIVWSFMRPYLRTTD